MSRWIEEMEDGKLKEEIADMDECSWMYNEVCCNDKSPHCADFPSEEICEKCPLFKKETNIEQ